MPQSQCLASASPAAKGTSLATGMKRCSIRTQGPTDGPHPVQPFTPIPTVLLLPQPPPCSANMLQKGLPQHLQNCLLWKKRTSLGVFFKFQIDVGASAMPPKDPWKRGGDGGSYSALRAHTG